MKIFAKPNRTAGYISRKAFHYNPSDLKRDDLSKEEYYKIISDIRVSGVWKTTSFGRLETTKFLAEKYFQAAHSYKFLDIGASAGITTYELYKHLADLKKGPIKAILADKNLKLLKYKRFGIIEYRSVYNEPVLLKIGKIGFRLPYSEHKFDFLNNLISSLYLGRHRFRSKMHKEYEIDLVPKFITEHPDFEVKEFDCTKEKSYQEIDVDLVRASNILNRSYFTDSVIAETVSMVKSCLKEHGVLIVSTNNSLNNFENFSVWRKKGNKFFILEKSAEGTEIDQIVQVS